jgi:hypothetical protein
MSSVYWQPRTNLIWAITSKIALTSQVSKTLTPTLQPPSPPLFPTGRLQGDFAIGFRCRLVAMSRIAYKCTRIPPRQLLVEIPLPTHKLLCDSLMGTLNLNDLKYWQNALTLSFQNSTIGISKFKDRAFSCVLS